MRDDLGLKNAASLLFSAILEANVFKRSVTARNGEPVRLELRPSLAAVFATIAAGSVGIAGGRTAYGQPGLITASLLMHECGHYLAARHFGIRVKAIGMSFKGGYTIRERSANSVIHSMTTLAGPLINLVLFAGFILVSVRAAQWIAFANLTLAVSNLLPIGPTDGMRLWRLLSSDARLVARETMEM